MVDRQSQKRRSLLLARAIFLLCLLTPTAPWLGGADAAKGEIDQAEMIKNPETFAVYSVLRANDIKLLGGAAWKLAQSILEQSNKHSVDPTLVLAIIKVESQFDHRAVSIQGARGLMQIVPFVARAVAKEDGIDLSKNATMLYDPIVNVKIGVAYLSKLTRMFNDLKLVLIAYNVGPTKVREKLATKGRVESAYATKVFMAQRNLTKYLKTESALATAG